MARPATIWEFAKSFGKHWLGSMSGGGGILAATAALGFNWTNAQTLGAAALVAFCIGSYLAWRDERLLVVLLDKDAALGVGRFLLAQLRQKGVALRNEAQFGFDDDEKVVTWMQAVEDWNGETVSSIAALNKADAEWFRIADIVEPPRIAMSQPKTPKEEHAFFLYNLHDFRLVKLEQLILRYGEQQAPVIAGHLP